MAAAKALLTMVERFFGFAKKAAGTENAFANSERLPSLLWAYKVCTSFMLEFRSRQPGLVT